jgi:hypothetical protein
MKKYLNLLPGGDAALMALTRPSKFSDERLVFYWLNTPSLTFARDTKDQRIVYEVFTFQPMVAEATTLPWHFVRLESFPFQIPLLSMTEVM